MSISLGGTVIADLRPSSVHGMPLLGNYLVRFFLTFLTYSMPGWPGKSYRFGNIQARVHVGKQPALLGRATSEVPMVLTSQSHSQDGTLSLEIPLTARQLDNIEQLRQGGDISFRLDVSGELYDGGYSHSYVSDTVQVPVNQKSWIDVLKELGFNSWLLLELPDQSTTNSTSNLRKVLEKAREHLYYGNYDDVVASCRMALEGIRADGEEITTVRHSAGNDRKSMSKRSRLVHVLDALEHYTHPAHHLEGIESYSRDDALFIFGATLAAVSTSKSRDPVD